MSADVYLSSGAGGAPETPDTDMAVEYMLVPLEQERTTNKLSDPAL